MTDRYRRFGDYRRVLTARRNELSYNAFNPELEWDAEGNLIPHRAGFQPVVRWP